MKKLAYGVLIATGLFSSQASANYYLNENTQFSSSADAFYGIQSEICGFVLANNAANPGYKVNFKFDQISSKQAVRSNGITISGAITGQQYEVVNEQIILTGETFKVSYKFQVGYSFNNILYVAQVASEINPMYCTHDGIL